MSKHDFSELLDRRTVMEPDDEIRALAAELRQRTAERDALAQKLQQTPAMREVIGELVAVLVEIQDRQNREAEKRLRELLKRIDRERDPA